MKGKEHWLKWKKIKEEAKTNGKEDVKSWDEGVNAGDGNWMWQRCLAYHQS